MEYYPKKKDQKAEEMSDEVIAYINEYGTSSILVPCEDGRLLAFGDDWKHCPRPEKPCPRPSTYEKMPELYDPSDPKCSQCTYTGVMYLKDKKQAAAVANLIALSFHHTEKLPNY